MLRSSPTLAHKMVASIPSQNLHQRVLSLLGMCQPGTSRIERRNEERYPYPKLIYLTPLKQDDLAQAPIKLVVTGKHLSESGLGFYHQTPLPYRRVIASFEQPDGNWLGLIMDITWCRFTKEGWYESGGRFIELVESPLNQTLASETTY
jgi:hypothetical protein